MEKEKTERKEKADFIGGFMFEVSEFGNAIEVFDEQLWMMAVHQVIVHPDGKLTFQFWNGEKLEI